MTFKVSILLIQGEPDRRAVISHCVKSAGYALTEVASGRSGLKKAEQLKPDIILIDRFLPDLDSFDFCHQIKANPILNDTFILMYSQNNNSPEERSAALQSGVDAFFTWPCSEQDLQAQINIFSRIRQKISISHQSLHRPETTEAPLIENSLVENEFRYRALFENAGLGIGYYTLDGVILSLNKTAAENMKGKPEDFTGRRIVELFGKEHGSVYLSRIKQVALSKNPLMFEDFVPLPAGKKWFLSTYSSIQDATGQTIGVQIISNDITDRKLAEEQLEKFRQIVACTTDGVALLDRNYTYLIVNDAYERFAGRPKNELIGKTVADYLGEDIFNRQIKENFDRCLQGEPVQFEDWFHYPGVGRRRASVAYFPYHNEAGEVIGLVASTRDLTDQRKTEQALQLSERRFSELFTTISSGVVIYEVLNDGEFGKDYIIRDFNPRALELEGKNMDEVQGKNLSDLRPNIDEYGLIPIFRKVWKTGISAHYPAKMYVDEKFYNWYENNVFRLPGGEIVAVYNDVTEQKQAEEALRASEERFKLAMQASLDGMYDWNLITNEIYYTPGWKKMLGYADDELENKFSIWEELTHPDDVKKSWTMLNEHITGKRDRFELEFRMLHRDGHWVEILSRANTIFDEKGKAARVVGTHVDISQRKKVERALLESQSQLSAILDNTSGSLWAANAEFKFILGNSLFKKNYKAAFGKEILPGDDVLCWIDDDELADWKSYYRRALAGEWFALERKRKFTDKTEWTEYRFSPILSGDAKPGGVIVLANDISDRKKAEVALMTAQANLEEAQQIAKIGSWEYDIESDTLKSTQTIFDIFEVPRELNSAGLGDFKMVLHPDDWPAIVTAIKRAISEGIDCDLEFRVLTLRNKIKWARGIGKSIRDKHDRIVKIHGTIQEITKQKNLEEQLRHAQKMDAIGKLAGGVAHDFNNLLTVINGYSDILLSELDRNHPFFDDLQQIHQAGLRAASLTSQLLAFSRKQILQPEVLNINNLLKNVQRMLQRLIGEDIDLTTNLARDLFDVKADRGQIEQIIVNMAVNARDAMPRGGTLKVITKNVLIDAEFIEMHANARAGSFVQISVRDNGIGMDETVLGHIFEPFFTTKATGKGTGLGLSTVYGIIQQSCGFITVESEPAKGTLFNIYLPALKRSRARKKSTAEPQQKITGTETILIAEDEVPVLNLIRKALNKAGYRLLTAFNGSEALQIARTHKNPIHLLLSDVVMPNMSGKELSEKIEKIHPETKVCLMSGYTDDALVRLGALDKRFFFLQKPFSPEVLSKKIREILDEAENDQ